MNHNLKESAITASTFRMSPQVGPTDITLSGYTAAVAGYTGRDQKAVQHHIDELAAIGVAPPPEVPMFYPMDASTISTAAHFTVDGASTSGEVEPLYVRHAGKFYLGVASDHTDRELEAVDIGDSKRACPKPVASALIPISDLSTFSLDRAIARSWVDGQIYQEGLLSNLLRPVEVIERFLARVDVGTADFVLLGGTLPLLNGQFVYGSHWRIQLTTVEGVRFDHSYSISTTTKKDVTP